MESGGEREASFSLHTPSNLHSCTRTANGSATYSNSLWTVIPEVAAKNKACNSTQVFYISMSRDVIEVFVGIFGELNIFQAQLSSFSFKCHIVPSNAWLNHFGILVSLWHHFHCCHSALPRPHIFWVFSSNNTVHLKWMFISSLAFQG